MSILYVEEYGAVIGIEENRFRVRYHNEEKTYIPAELLEGIVILGKAQLTTQCIEECLKRGIPVSFLSKAGNYFGRMISTGHVKTTIQRKQCFLYDTEFAVELAKKIIRAKIKNQLTVVRRYKKEDSDELTECIKMMSICIEKIERTEQIQGLIGYEGQAAKHYFKALSILVDSSFKFQGRSRRPPKDEFNSMISLGYSIMMNEIYSQIELRGLNPYFGFLHRDAERHPTLVSDLLEEWRAVVVDSVVMSMINGHEILPEDFQIDPEFGGYYMRKEGLKKFLKKLESRLQREVKYLDYISYAVSFRQAISLQAGRLIKAIDSVDAEEYHPIIIR